MKFYAHLLLWLALLVAPVAAQQAPANQVMASPNGSAGLMRPRALVQADIPFTLGAAGNVRDSRFAGGALGNSNGSTGNGNDDTAAIQAAINAANTGLSVAGTSSAQVFVPCGTYRITGLSVTVAYPVTIYMIGEGACSQIYLDNPSAATALAVTGSPDCGIQPCVHVEGINFITPRTAAGSIAVSVNLLQVPTFIGNRFQGYGTAIKLVNSYAPNVWGNTFINNLGAALDCTTDSSCNGGRFENNNLFANGVTSSVGAVRVGTAIAGGCTTTTFAFNKNDVEGNYSGLDVRSVCGVQIEGNYFESNTSTPFNFTGFNQQISVRSNWIYNNGASGTPKTFQLASATDVVFQNNVFADQALTFGAGWTTPWWGPSILAGTVTGVTVPLRIVPGTTLSAERTLTVTTGDNDRTLDISAANTTISSFATTFLDDTTAAAVRTTIGAGTGDVTGQSSSVDSEVALFSSTTGKVIKRATTTGILKGTSGVLSAATQGTDYYAPGGTDVAVVDGGTGSSTAAGAATNLGLGTGDSPQFTAVNVGNATDTTVSRASAGDINVEGNIVYRAGGTDVSVTDGGTGSSTAANARTALGVVIGTDVEAHDADLTTIAGLTATTNNVVQSVSSAWASRTPAQLTATLPQATTSAQGVAETATDAEANARSSTTVVLTPSNLAAAPAFSANKNGTDQTGITASTVTKVTFTTETIDVGSYYDAPNSKWTPPAGKYYISCTLYYTGGVTAANVYTALIQKASGATTVYNSIAIAAGTSVVVTAAGVIDANGTDDYTCYAYGEGVGNKTINGGAVNVYFQGFAL